MKPYKKEITVYPLPDGFAIEVSEIGGNIYFHMTHEKYGAKMFMFELWRDPAEIPELVQQFAAEWMTGFAAEIF